MSYELGSGTTPNRLLAGFLIGGLGMGGIAYVKEHSTEVGNALHAVAVEAGENLGLVDPSCAVPSPQAIQEVQTMLAQPAEYWDIVYSYEEEGVSDSQMPAKIGEHYGVTIQETFNHEIDTVNASQEEAPLRTLEEAAAPFGIEVTIETDDETAPTDDELRSGTADAILGHVERHLLTQPKEYFEASNLRRVISFLKIETMTTYSSLM